MAIFFSDYKQFLLHDYEQKKANNALSPNLKFPSPAKLKKECLIRCESSLNRQDEKTIKDFCGNRQEGKSCSAVLKAYETDKFKPLVNFLKGKSDNTDEKNIELLAWLIDVPDRPWEKWKSQGGVHESQGDAGGELVELEVTSGPAESLLTGITGISGESVAPEGLTREGGAYQIHTAFGAFRPKKNTKKLIAPIIILLAIGTAGIWWWKERPQQDFSGGCMYWAGDHYEPVACNQKVPNARLIALDTVRLINFKKITAPDTITALAIGNVWYSKLDGKIEFYTWGGEHPIDYDYQLKPITSYIINKYILSGVVSKQ